MKLAKVVVSLALLSAVLDPGLSSASCAGPEISVTGRAARDFVAPGDTFQVSGRYWSTGDCEDTESSGGGCAWFGQSEADRQLEETQPYRDLVLTLRGPLGKKSQTSIRLTVVPEMVGGRFKVKTTVPDVPPGTYEITNDQIDYAKDEIVIRPER